MDDPIRISDTETAAHARDTETIGSFSDGFDEAAYLEAFPDIARAIESGHWGSARHHYIAHGLRERRLSDQRYLRVLGSKLAPGAEAPARNPRAAGLDAVFATRSGWCLVVGWVDDHDTPLNTLQLCAGAALLATSNCMARCRRVDAETAINSPAGPLLGFWTLLRCDNAARLGDSVSVVLQVDGAAIPFDIKAECVTELRLREIVFGYFAGATYFSNRQVESFLQLENGLGERLTRYSADIAQRIVAGAYAARFGPRRQHYEASIVVCLYGKPEFLFLQAALFSAAPGAHEYEFIYVSNSPHLAEGLQKEATIAAAVYGISITLVILPENAGFGAANNAAAGYASSSRILIVNPDVFPREADWAARHVDLLRRLPKSQTALFGVPLFYDDGSLMHGGLYFDMDEVWSVRPGGVARHAMVRVEHYGKGAAAADPRYQISRAVPGITGAFMSIDRAWFEKLGGFSIEYAFGHYEDADLCLKSFCRGRPAWIHPLPFWHLEGKGSTRLPEHEGGSLLNRWHFTTTWRAVLEDGLVGKSPAKFA